MNVDIAALRAIERDKDIPFETVLEAIETALLTAYRHTEGHQPHARVDIDRKTGVVRVLAQETGDDGAVGREWDDTPEGFGRIAATTARQVIVQRLRDAEHERTYGEFAPRRARSSPGSCSATPAPTPAAWWSSSSAAAPRACCRRPSRCRGSGTSTASGCAATSSASPGECAARRSRSPAPTRTWCASCSPSRCPSSSTAPWRSSRSRGRPGTAPRSPCGRRCRG